MLMLGTGMAGGAYTLCAVTKGERVTAHVKLAHQLTRRENAVMAEQIQELTEHLRAATNILVFTGAGISTGSGIPDFRGPDGVWKRRQPVYYDDFMRFEAARIEHWDYKLEGWAGF